MFNLDLGNLLVHLRADTTQYKQSMSDVEKAVASTMNSMQSMSRNFGLAFAGAVSYIAGAQVIGAFRSLTAAAIENERAIRNLRLALSTVGEATPGVIKQLTDFSTRLANVTLYTKQDILQQMAFAQNMGISTNEIAKVTLAAVGLATKLNIDLGSAIHAIIRATAGHTEQLARLGLQIPENISAQEKFNLVLNEGLKYLAQGIEKSAGLEGSVKKLGEQWSDFKAKLAEKLELKGVIDLLDQILNLFDKMTDKMAEMATLQVKTENLIPQSARGAFAGVAEKTKYAVPYSIREAWLRSFTGEGLLLTPSEIDKEIKFQLSEVDYYQKELSRAMSTKKYPFPSFEDTFQEWLRPEATALPQGIFDKIAAELKKASEGIAPGAAPTKFAVSEEEIAKAKKIAEDKVRITAAMYSQIGAYDQKWRDASIAAIDLDAQKYAEATGNKVLAEQWRIAKIQDLGEEAYKALVEPVLKAYEEEKKLAADQVKEVQQQAAERVQATATLYEDMKGMSRAHYDAEIALLDMQFQNYVNMGVPLEALIAWYKDEAEQAEIRALQSSESIADGFRAAGLQIKREFKTWGERAYEFSMSLENSIASGLESSMRNMKNFGDAMKSMLEEIYWEAVRIAFISPVAKGFAGVLTGIGASLFGPSMAGTPVGGRDFSNVSILQAHIGGIIGRTAFPLVPIPVSAFENAPSYHSGKGGIAAWLQENEHVLTEKQANYLVGLAGRGNQGGIAVHIHNEGGPIEVTKTESYMLSDQRILDVTVRAMQTKTSYRRTVAQVRQ